MVGRSIHVGGLGALYARLSPERRESCRPNQQEPAVNVGRKVLFGHLALLVTRAGVSAFFAKLALAASPVGNHRAA